MDTHIRDIYIYEDIHTYGDIRIYGDIHTYGIYTYTGIRMIILILLNLTLSVCYNLFMIIIPAIDLLDGSCVRLLKGNYNESTVYNYDPV